MPGRRSRTPRKSSGARANSTSKGQRDRKAGEGKQTNVLVLRGHHVKSKGQHLLISNRFGRRASFACGVYNKAGRGQ
eukprot:4574045-Lingulodinium_polyedra.AAC.1